MENAEDTVHVTEMTLEEIVQVDDLDLGHSVWLRVDQAMIDGFAATTGDHQWIHVDVERAAGGPFGSTIAHGYLTVSLVPRLLFEMLRLKDAAAVVNYGLEKLRFMEPVPAGAEVQLRARLIKAFPRFGGILFRVRVELRRRDSGRRVLVAEMLYLAQPA